MLGLAHMEKISRVRCLPLIVTHDDILDVMGNDQGGSAWWKIGAGGYSFLLLLH